MTRTDIGGVETKGEKDVDLNGKRAASSEGSKSKTVKVSASLGLYLGYHDGHVIVESREKEACRTCLSSGRSVRNYRASRYKQDYVPNAGTQRDCNVAYKWRAIQERLRQKSTTTIAKQ